MVHHFLTKRQTTTNIDGASFSPKKNDKDDDKNLQRNGETTTSRKQKHRWRIIFSKKQIATTRNIDGASFYAKCTNDNQKHRCCILFPRKDIQTSMVHPFLQKKNDDHKHHKHRWCIIFSKKKKRQRRPETSMLHSFSPKKQEEDK